MDLASKQTHITTITFLVLLTTSAAIVLVTLQGLQYGVHVDEGYYWTYALTIVDRGFGAFKDLAANFVQDQKNWVFPPPTRIGFITLSSLFVGLFGRSIVSLSYLSLFGYLLFLIITSHFVRKHFDSEIALSVVTICAFSPLQMAMARRALTDAVANASVILSLWLFFEAIQERNRSKTILFVAVYSLALLVKETAALVAVFFVVYLLARQLILRPSLKCSPMLAPIALSFGITFIVWMFLIGGIVNVATIVKIVLTSPSTNSYAVSAGDGPWFRYLIDFMLLSPWSCLLAVGFFFCFFFSIKGRQEIVVYWSIYVIVSLMEYDFFTKNLRYAISLDMPLRLFAILMLVQLFQTLPQVQAARLLKAGVIVIAVLDYLRFIDLFVVMGIYDPVSYWLLVGERFIPGRN